MKGLRSATDQKLNQHATYAHALSASPPGDFLLVSYCANSLCFIAVEISFVNNSILCLDFLQTLKITILFSCFKDTHPLHFSLTFTSPGDSYHFLFLRWENWGPMAFSHSPSAHVNRNPLFLTAVLCSSKQPHCIESSSLNTSSSFQTAASHWALSICPVESYY